MLKENQSVYKILSFSFTNKRYPVYLSFFFKCTMIVDLYPWTKVEKSMLSTLGDRQSGRRTEQRQRIFQRVCSYFWESGRDLFENEKLILKKMTLNIFALFKVCPGFFDWMINIYLCRDSTLDDRVGANIVGVQPVELLVDLLPGRS